jgi:hypothetical protein
MTILINRNSCAGILNSIVEWSLKIVHIFAVHMRCFFSSFFERSFGSSRFSHHHKLELQKQQQQQQQQQQHRAKHSTDDECGFGCIDN